MYRNEPVLKDGPNTASRRRPLKRPQREPTEHPLFTIWRASVGQSYDHGPRPALAANPHRPSDSVIVF
jgi:hypothetical protein